MARANSKTDIKKLTAKKSGTSSSRKTSSTTRKRNTTKTSSKVKKEILVSEDAELVEKTINRKENISEATGKIPVKKVKEVRDTIKKETASKKKESTTESTGKIPIKKVKEARDEIKSELKDDSVSETTGKIPVKKINDKKSLSKEEIIAQRKERNRKKYQSQQRKYQESKGKTKKIPVIPAIEREIVNVPSEEVKEESVTPVEPATVESQEEKKIVEEDTVTIVESDLIKKEIHEELPDKEKIEERKEKRKTNRKSDQFTKTLSNIKTKSVDTINTVKEKTTDRNIPVGKSKEEKKKRTRRFIKEAIVYSIILTIINVLCIVIFDYFNFLRLFDVKYLNVIVTIVISLIFNFFIAFMVDYFVTEVWLKGKRKEKDGEQNGDNGVNEEEY